MEVRGERRRARREEETSLVHVGRIRGVEEANALVVPRDRDEPVGAVVEPVRRARRLNGRSPVRIRAAGVLGLPLIERRDGRTAHTVRLETALLRTGVV